ncbi:DUF1080 domain-containing protein [Prevotella sp. 10(H)]|uniref:DUF1080 domain-containing protein n=1 Tax=Prevotella sp. 10(H) TaxID=1158294 RepID=UPI0004A6AE66|nr:DUF1080 domain-containing protein [Prevotella sp. 10(H)]
MNKAFAILICLCSFFLSSCDSSKSKDLFNGFANKYWDTSGNVTMKDSIFSLKGEQSYAVLKNAEYQDFDLCMDLRTTTGGKGYIAFHTDSEGKGHRVAINNDRLDPVWWRMTGSLMSVRNLTKSFVKENEWFKMNIRVEGQSVTVRINDEPVVEYIEPSRPFRTEKNIRSILSQGTFSLVSTGLGAIQFKNIHVEALDRKIINIPAQLEVAKDEQSDDIIRLHQEDFPVLDYHVHLKGGLTKENAAKQSRKLGINYAIAPNCGIGFPITDDKGIYDFLKTMRTEPFILAMQAEGREWLTTFSQEARDEFDFVFTDALTFTDKKGRRTRLWIKEETWIENEQEYMDMIVDKICDVLQEPVDIYVNPCFLPEPMDQRYDEFWTEARMDKFVDALAKSGKALEINELYQIPNKAIIMKAKAAGVKFTFGSNNVTPEVSKLEYSIYMKNECGLTASDMYKPKIKI